MPSAVTRAVETHYVSTMQVAQALGVGVTTVKRWVDEGVLPAHRTAGGHRKLRLDDVLRLVREKNLPQVDLGRLAPAPSREKFNDLATLRDHLIQVLEQPDPAQVRLLIHGAYQHGHALAQIADQIIAPAMQHVGHEWEAGRIAVAQEHLATQTVVSALYELRTQLRSRRQPGRWVALGGAPEHDFTILGSLLAKMVLMEGGWEAIDLGPHTPVSALHTAVQEFRPRLVWLSISHLIDPEQFLREYREFYGRVEKLGTAVAVGGRALTEAIRRDMPYTSFGDGLAQLAAFGRTLQREQRADTSAR